MEEAEREKLCLKRQNAAIFIWNFSFWAESEQEGPL